MTGQTQGRRKGLGSCSGAGEHPAAEAFWQGSLPKHTIQVHSPTPATWLGTGHLKQLLGGDIKSKSTVQMPHAHGATTYHPRRPAGAGGWCPRAPARRCTGEKRWHLMAGLWWWPHRRGRLQRVTQVARSRGWGLGPAGTLLGDKQPRSLLGTGGSGPAPAACHVPWGGWRVIRGLRNTKGQSPPPKGH